MNRVDDRQTDLDTVPEPEEVAPVREGEELDWAALEAHLREHLDLSGPFEVLQFPNGSANLTYMVSFGNHQLVLRRPPFGQLAKGAHDMRREYRALSCLWQVYPRAPRAFHLCTDHDVIGSDFLVMEYRPGIVVWRAVPSSMTHLPDAGQRIGMAVVDALADLHRVEPRDAGLEDLGRPDGFLERQVRGWRRRWDDVADVDADQSMARLGRELTRTLPATTVSTILHNDFKIDNCQFREGDPDTVVSVFDWDMTTLGDPLVDLGTLLNYWPDPGDDPDTALAVPGIETIGLPSRQEVVARYADRSGISVDHVEWYLAYGCWKTAIILQQLYARYLRGETSDLRMARRGEQVAGLAARGLALLTTSRKDSS